MLSKCANPACFAPFLRLTEGKLFQVETHLEPSSRLDESRRKPPRRTEYYWLCAECCRFLTLASKEGTIITIPLPAIESLHLVRQSEPPRKPPVPHRKEVSSFQVERVEP
jgi:hypothetical protein